MLGQPEEEASRILGFEQPRLAGGRGAGRDTAHPLCTAYLSLAALSGVAVSCCPLSPALPERADSAWYTGFRGLSWDLEGIELDSAALVRQRSSG